MKKTIVGLLVAIAVSLGIIVLQRTENTKLRKETELLRASQASPSMLPRSPAETGSEGDKAVSPGGQKEGRRPLLNHSPAGLREVLAMPDPMNRIRALLAYVDHLDPEDIPAALDDLRKSSPDWDPDAKILAHMLLTRWAQEDPEGAFASLDSLDFKQKGAQPHIILASLASMDPKRAAAWLEDPDNELVHFPWMGHILAGTVAKEWVRQDPDAALAWAETVPGKQRLGAYTGVLGTLATTDPQRASALATEIEPGGARNHIVGEIAKTWAKTAPNAALEWTQSLEGDERKRATGEALGTWAQTQPAEAVAFLERLSTDEDIDPYVPRVAENWAAREPDEAAAWVATQPEGNGKNEAMGSVMWNWTTRDPEAASDWLSEQPASASRDQGIVGLGKAAFEFDPAGSLDWATRISDEDVRRGTIDGGLRRWRQRAPEAAQEWATRNGFGGGGDAEGSEQE